MAVEHEATQASAGRLLASLTGTSGFHWDRLDDEWQALFQTYVQGMYGRSVLDQKTRELCAVAALTALDRQRALQKHVLAAFDHGASRDEVLEVVLQMSVYGGFPATLSALETLRTLFARLDETAPDA